MLGCKKSIHMQQSTSSDFAILAICRDGLADLTRRLSTFVDAQGVVPRTPSPAMDEEASFPDPELIHKVVEQANLLIEVMADHLSAFVKTITPPAETLAPWTCVRIILESGAVVAWLLDSSLDARTRIGRSLALRHDGLDMSLKYCKLVGSSVAGETAQRILELEKTATLLGLPKIIPMPPATHLVRDYLDEEEYYRLLSGVVHGHSWAVRTLGFRPVDVAEPVRAQGYHASQKHINPLGMQALAVVAAGSIGYTAWRQASYYGWDLKGLRQAIEPPFWSLSVPVDRRPWS